MDLFENWPTIKQIFRRAFRSSFHYAISCTDANGEPHITPIGSLILTTPGKGFYFEEFSRNLPAILQSNPRICVLAVDSSPWFWIRSLISGQFKQPPAIRLKGQVGEARPATDEEIARWHRRVRWFRGCKGHQYLWKRMAQVRDIEFDRVQAIDLGSMTNH